MIIAGPDARPIDVGNGYRDYVLTHKEADVLMTYHMIQEALAGHTSIRIASDDTDVLTILAHHLYERTNNLPNTVHVSMESCIRNRAVIDVNEVVKTHIKILAAHALTGCDTVSSFAGVGKTTVLKKLKTFTDTLNLSDSSIPSDDVLDPSLRFVVTFYGQTYGEEPLDNMRASIFTPKISGKRHVSPKLSTLPPTMAAFIPHC